MTHTLYDAHSASCDAPGVDRKENIEKNIYHQSRVKLSRVSRWSAERAGYLRLTRGLVVYQVVVKKLPLPQFATETWYIQWSSQTHRKQPLHAISPPRTKVGTPDLVLIGLQQLAKPVAVESSRDRRRELNKSSRAFQGCLANTPPLDMALDFAAKL